MKKTDIKSRDNTEFVDDEGKKWIQTSAEDLFSIKELNEIIESIEKKDEPSDEIILARIDFQRVNKDYYEQVQELKNKLNKRTDILKRLAVESRHLIETKNRKLSELIEYIKKLHMLLAYYNLKPEEIEKMEVPPHFLQGMGQQKAAVEQTIEDVDEEEYIGYTDVEEIILDDDGNEAGPVSA